MYAACPPGNASKYARPGNPPYNITRLLVVVGLIVAKTSAPAGRSTGVTNRQSNTRLPVVPVWSPSNDFVARTLPAALYKTASKLPAAGTAPHQRIPTQVN